jgi:hypothetical protein
MLQVAKNDSSTERFAWADIKDKTELFFFAGTDTDAGCTAKPTPQLSLLGCP